jgi:hypothetical protein
MFSAINFDLVSVTVPCLAWVTYYDSMTMTILTPLIASAAIVVCTFLGNLCGMVQNPKSTSIALILKLIFICFPGCSAAPLKLFVCKEIFGDMYITADYRLKCVGEDYASYSNVAVFGILVPRCYSIY